jgi:Flp pilus assembly protein TadD
MFFASQRASRSPSLVLLALITGVFGCFVAFPADLGAQGRGRGASTPRSDSTRQAQRFDGEFRHQEARAIFQALIDNAPTPADRAAAQRRLALSYAYDGNCAKSIELEEQVIAYWVTRREAEPQNAHYQEGEMANEAARICIDAGFLDEAERMYRRGSDLGNREPEPRTHPKSLWDFRLSHALARIAARRGNADEAKRHVAEARRILDSDPKMAEDQEQYYPYLVGYVALYTNDLATAERELTKAMAGLPNDPFQVVLLGMTLEKKGDQGRAREMYQKAFDMATGSNPPNVHSRAFTRKKLGR